MRCMLISPVERASFTRLPIMTEINPMLFWWKRQLHGNILKSVSTHKRHLDFSIKWLNCVRVWLCKGSVYTSVSWRMEQAFNKRDTAGRWSRAKVLVCHADWPQSFVFRWNYGSANCSLSLWWKMNNSKNISVMVSQQCIIYCDALLKVSLANTTIV